MNEEALGRTSRVLARIRQYSIETYQAIRLLFTDRESELDDLNERVRELENRVSDRKEKRSE